LPPCLKVNGCATIQSRLRYDPYSSTKRGERGSLVPFPGSSEHEEQSSD
jgi:hypothetical protein